MMSPFRIVMRLLAMVLGVAAFCQAGEGESRPRVELLVPAYVYPGQDQAWERLTIAAKQVPVTAILNPASGPGRTADPNYQRVVPALRKAGGKVLAYVSTSYGKRDLARVKADIEKYLSFYSIDGFFLDEMANDTDPVHLAYYEELYRTIRGKNPKFRVVGNPGTNTQEAYLTRPTANTLVVYEMNKGYDVFVFDGWISRHPSQHFAHLLYQVPTSSELHRSLQIAKKRNVGFVYITDDGKDGNPWDRLPTYWDEEVRALAEWNRQ